MYTEGQDGRCTGQADGTVISRDTTDSSIDKYCANKKVIITCGKDPALKPLETTICGTEDTSGMELCTTPVTDVETLAGSDECCNCTSLSVATGKDGNRKRKAFCLKPSGKVPRCVVNQYVGACGGKADGHEIDVSQ